MFITDYTWELLRRICQPEQDSSKTNYSVILYVLRHRLLWKCQCRWKTNTNNYGSI